MRVFIDWFSEVDHVPVEGDSDKADVAQPDTGSTLSSATEVLPRFLPVVEYLIGLSGEGSCASSVQVCSA